MSIAPLFLRCLKKFSGLIFFVFIKRINEKKKGAFFFFQAIPRPFSSQKNFYFFFTLGPIFNLFLFKSFFLGQSGKKTLLKGWGPKEKPWLPPAHWRLLFAFFCQIVFGAIFFGGGPSSRNKTKVSVICLKLTFFFAYESLLGWAVFVGK